jgi:pyridoxal phosphate enzyme (YggS family)
MSVADNLNLIKSQLPDDVTLIAVSKTKPTENLLEAYKAGQKDFGENYVQELVDKHTQLPKDINWHFIGHLQSNKVKYIAPFVHLIHGVDSYNLLKEINKQAQKNNRVIPCLLQIYIAKEESKFGLDEFEAEELLISNEFNQLQNIKIIGLMGMATNTDNEKMIEIEFKSLKIFFDYLKSSLGEKHNLKLDILSMGMSSDYKLAIKNGSNMVRIGSSIFGLRTYHQ